MLDKYFLSLYRQTQSKKSMSKYPNGNKVTTNNVIILFMSQCWTGAEKKNILISDTRKCSKDMGI